MRKWNVYGTVTIGVQMVVEADNEYQAIELAETEWPGLNDYAGNGRNSGRLVGHAEENLILSAGDDYPDFGLAEEAK